MKKAKFRFLWGAPILWVKKTTTGGGALISSINPGCSSKKSFLSLLLKLLMRWYVVDMIVTILHLWDFIFRLEFGGFPYFILRLSNLAFRHSVYFLYVKLFISYEYHLNQLVSFSLFACLVIKLEIASSVCFLSVPLDEDSILSKRETERERAM